MNLIELSNLLLDEARAEEYLRSVGIMKTFINCEKCGSEKLGRIRREKNKCYNCKYEWKVRKGSILYKLKISFSCFAGLIKMFELDINPSVAATQLFLNQNLVKKTYSIFRKVIIKSEDICHTEYEKKFNGDSLNLLINVNNGKIYLSIINDTISLVVKVKRTRNYNGRIIYTIKNKEKYLDLFDKKSEKEQIVYEFLNYINEKLLIQ